ncbi:thiamine-phosphate kinase [Haliea sp. E1-2-M8]|uniref:thiamine-phosphate kinase n=1 Tax=Haliea sp. E1-2-M8 TaxID=3064706 RepID=UPI0027158B66|nr:thiamine-phosphate kinase [Haliea sp. E1-2-M8]MDO8863492.1 thiamine-phosphate kinase [Haliea sp. E1-2-M8]
MPADEFSLIARYFSAFGAGPAVALGVGDDCAILKLEPGERLATSVDTVVAGVHFLEESLPEDVGYRAVAAAASDLAAMGARPLGMTLALTLPDADELWLHSFSQGVGAAATDLALPLVGGDTTRGPLTITVQVFGALPAGKALLRGGAQLGDAVYVSGTLGDAAGGLALLEGRYRPDPAAAEYLEQRFFRPSPRLALGMLLLNEASAAIDISDGLLADAGHIAAASGVRIQLDPERLPLSPALAAHPDRDQVLRWALAGGDDYELCFCLSPGAAVPADCTRVGEVVAGEGVSCPGFDGLAAGYNHFL